MGTNILSRLTEKTPTLFEDFFKPWNEWFENGSSMLSRTMNVPAVNITETKDAFKVTLAAPGLKKDDFKIDIDGNMLTISSEKEENKEEKEGRFTRKEYNYSSFSRTFTLPDEVNKESVNATYVDGILTISLPCVEGIKKPTVKQITVK